MPKKESTTEVAERPETGLVAPVDFGGDEGENADADSTEILIPFIGVLQAQSPQVLKDEIEGAKAGMFFNSVTNEIYDGETGCVFVIVYREHNYLEYLPRDEGGGGGTGFRGKYDFESDFVQQIRAKHEAETGNEFGKIKLSGRGKDNKENTELSEAFTVYGLLLTPDGLQVISPAAMTFASAKIKAYKGWRSQQAAYMHPTPPTKDNPEGGKVRPPLYAHLVRVTTRKETNTKGTFFTVTLAPALQGPIPGSDRIAPSMGASIIGPGDDRYEMAKMVLASVKRGDAKADFGASNETSEEPAPSAPPPDDDIPF